MAVVGGVSYRLSVWLALVQLGPFIGGDRTERLRRAYALTLVPYFTGAALHCGTGLLNPRGMILVSHH